MNRLPPLLALALVTVGCLAHAQQTLLVPSQFSTIQSAVDAAVAGDTVLVEPGNYLEMVQIFKGITVRSTSGPSVTHIDGTNQTTTVTISGSTASSTPVLEGFTLRNATSLPLNAQSPVVIRDVTITASETALEITGSATDPTAILESCRIESVIGRPAISLPFPGCGVPVDGASMVSISSSATVLMTNCIVANNKAGDGDSIVAFCGPRQGTGGSLFFVSGSLFLANCTMTRNMAGLAGGFGSPHGDVFRLDGASASIAIANSIVRGNTSPNGYIFSAPPSAVLFTNTDGFPHGNNIDLPAFFVDAANGDLRLLPNSPCIDAASSVFPGLPPIDIEGHPRVVGAEIDMGAHEYVAPLLGTEEGLELLTTIDGRGGHLDAKLAPGGSTLVAELVDTDVFATGGTPVLLGQAFRDDDTPTGLPALDLWLDPMDLVVFFDGQTTPGPTVGPTPIVWGPVIMPHGLDSLVLRLQAFSLTSNAANGGFVATRARDLLFR